MPELAIGGYACCRGVPPLAAFPAGFAVIVKPAQHGTFLACHHMMFLVLPTLSFDEFMSCQKTYRVISQRMSIPCAKMSEKVGLTIEPRAKHKNRLEKLDVPAGHCMTPSGSDAMRSWEWI